MADPDAWTQIETAGVDHLYHPERVTNPALIRNIQR